MESAWRRVRRQPTRENVAIELSDIARDLAQACEGKPPAQMTPSVRRFRFYPLTGIAVHRSVGGWQISGNPQRPRLHASAPHSMDNLVALFIQSFESDNECQLLA